MKIYLKYVKKYWYCFVLGPFFMILEALGEIVLPYINANIINEGVVRKDIGYIVQNGICMALIAVFMLVTGILGTNFSVRGSSRFAAGIRKDVFRQIQKLSFANIDEFTTGSLITRITNDITHVQHFSQTLLRGVFRSPIMLVGALAMSFILEPKLALIIFAIVPFLALAITVIIKTASPRYTKMQVAIDGLNNSVSETITNEKVIKSFVREEYQIGKFAIVNDALVEKSVSALKVMLFMHPVSTLAINLATLLVIWFAGEPIMLGNMEIGTLTAFITYLSQILMSLNFVANVVLQGARAAASHRRIQEVMNANIDLTDEDATHKDKTVEQGSIEFKHVNFRYYKNNTDLVLQDINLQIQAGELVGIIGSTGSGKSTLVSLISRLYDADEGEVFVDGINVKEYSLTNLREKIAVVLQKNTLFSGTIAENLRWGNEAATDEEITRVAKIAQADSFIRSFPNGYESDIGRGGANLSGGQRQRLCIARALLKNPKIIILDDSTSAVDTATDASIRKAFREQLGDTTKLVIAQRITSVIDADKIVVMDGGRIVGVGKHEDLIGTCKTYQEIYYSQKEE